MSLFYSEERAEPKGANIFFAVVAVVFLLAVLLMAVLPTYRVWSSRKAGEAELAQANANRQIKVVEAEAANLAATSQAEAQIKIAKAQAQAEVERAKGAAEANRIVAEGLKGHEEYLRYLWITHLESGDNKEVIYIPTEAGLPILEAGKR